MVHDTGCESSSAVALTASGLHAKAQEELAHLSRANRYTPSCVVFIGKAGIEQTKKGYGAFGFAFVWSQDDYTFALMADGEDGLHLMSPPEPTFLHAFLAGMQVVNDCRTVKK